MPTVAITLTLGAYDTYDTLVAAIPDYLDGQIDSTQVPGWLGLVEAEINRRLALDPVRPQLQRQSVSLGAEYVALPGDFQKEVAIDYLDADCNRETVRFVDWTGFTDDAANPVPDEWLFSASIDDTGEPEVAAIIDGEMRLYPIPDATYAATLLYYRTLDALSETNQQNWLIAAHSDVYLYGALHHAYAFLPDNEKRDYYGLLFDSRMNQVLTSYPKTVTRRKRRTDMVGLLGSRYRSNGYSV